MCEFIIFEIIVQFCVQNENKNRNNLKYVQFGFVIVYNVINFCRYDFIIFRVMEVRIMRFYIVDQSFVEVFLLYCVWLFFVVQLLFFNLISLDLQ